MFYKTFKSFTNRYGDQSTSNFDSMKIAKDIGKDFYKQFRVVMRDELHDIPNHVKYIICNNQDSNSAGSHWTAVFRDKAKAFVFDSYGRAPSDDIIDFLDYTNERYYSTFVLQSNQQFCGQVSMWVLYNLFKGKDYFDIILNLKETISKIYEL